MATPVIGPIVETSDSADYYSYRKRYGQARPIDRPLPYMRHVASVTSRTGDSSARASSAVGWDMSQWFCDMTALHSSTYEKLKSKITDRAEVAVNLLEVDRSVRMIRDRSVQIFKFVRALKRGDLVGAAKTLKMASVPKGASVKKSVSRNYLEFHFGWSPLIQDIHSAVGHLENPLKNTFVKASGRVKDVRRQGSLVILDNPGAYDPTVRWSKQEDYWRATPSISMGMEIAINNPNLYLASSMGLVNPATIVWELIPFSFVVDWFVNVQQFLAQGTDFLGLTVMNPWTTVTYKGVYVNSYEATVYTIVNDWTTEPPTSYTTQRSVKNAVGISFTMTERSLGITGPELHVRPFKVWGWRRAASAVSLLVLQLKGR